MPPTDPAQGKIPNRKIHRFDVGIYELKICLPCHEITEQVFDYIEVAGSYWGDPDAGSQPEDYAEWATDTDYPDTPEKQAYRVRAGLTRNAGMVP